MKISSGLAEGQVLQRLGSRGAEVKIIGDCSQAGPVTVSLIPSKGGLKNWKGRKVGTAAKGKFFAVLKDIPAGGPYRLELACGKETVRVREFFVGDVWVLGGQSNMQGYGSMAGAPKPHPRVRAFTMRRVWGKAVEPICVPPESPDACHNGGQQLSVEMAKAYRKGAGQGVGPGLPFAEEMWKRTGIPQGLICVAHGGTSMTQWSPQRLIDGKISLYGSMLDSIGAAGQPVAGMLWYQGESDTNAEAAPLYTERMRKLVQSFRKDIGQASAPWIMVQIGRVFRDETPPAEKLWNSVQEQQRLLPKSIKNLAVVAAVDLSLDDNIHISADGQRRLGVRLAREADRMVCGNRREAAPPQVKSIGSPSISKGLRVSPNLVAEVVFDGVAGDLRSNGEPSGFALVDDEGKDLRAIFKTTLHGNVARLHLRSGFLGSRLCYGMGTLPVCNITDGRDQALLVFGPQRLGKPRAFLPFVKQWRVSEPLESPLPLSKIPAPVLNGENSGVKVYGANEFNLEGFVNEHPRWQGRIGHGYFEAVMELPEPMLLEVMLGYDGPFRLWFNRKPFFTDLLGTNPCFADQSSKRISLPKGRHSIQVAMDTNHGAAWGFFLRFCRTDVAGKKIEAGDYAKPVYGV